jgi:hypothetical protein
MRMQLSRRCFEYYGVANCMIRIMGREGGAQVGTGRCSGVGSASW